MFRLRLKELRENAGFSQYSFADAFGVAQSTVGSWEAGKREPNFGTMQRLADFFDVSVDYLLGRNDAPAPAQLTARDNRDIAKSMDELREQLLHEDGLLFDGEPLSPEAIESILAAMKLGLEAAKQRNKEKYTPNKHKKSRE